MPSRVALVIYRVTPGPGLAMNYTLCGKSPLVQQLDRVR